MGRSQTKGTQHMKSGFDIPKDSIFTKELGKMRMQQGSVKAGQIRREQIAKTETKYDSSKPRKQQK